VVATAILDRLLHHSHVITIRATAIASSESSAVDFCKSSLYCKRGAEALQIV
jgi:hypothetical protein